MKILIIEDEPRMLQLLKQGLREHGCAVMAAPDGETGLELAAECEFDAILLDIGLPGRSGYDVIRLLRERSQLTPILILSACDGEDDIIRGLDLGADDYMTKPFSFQELFARLQCITRPNRDCHSTRIAVGDLVIDSMRHSVSRANVPINLTRTEFLLLNCLARNADRSVPRKTLIETVWGANHDVTSGALDVLVNSLRNKIDRPTMRRVILTVRGTGYALRLTARQSQV